MTTAQFTMLNEAIEGLQNKRDVSLYVADKWYKVVKLTNEPVDDGAAFAEVITGVKLIFPIANLGAVLID